MHSNLAALLVLVAWLVMLGIGSAVYGWRYPEKCR
jgi:hypothetical protein